MSQFLREVRQALRSLARDKAFTFTVVGTIAVCIAANSATFAIVNSVLLEPLPVPESESILLMANRYPGAGAADSVNSGVPDYFDRRREVSAFEEQAMFRRNGATLEIGGTPRRVDAMAVTPTLFPLLRVPPALGRAFDDEEGEIGNHRKLILSHRLWQELYAGDQDALGRDLRIDGEAHTIVGVMPSDFSFFDPDVRLWRPLTFTPEEKQAYHSNSWYHIGRLAPGASLEQAQAQVDVLNAANMDKLPELKPLLLDAGFHTKVIPLQDVIIGDVRNILFLLWGGAALVLLIGALNIANLALVRLTLRRREVATRRALGASGSQAARQLMIESVLTALAGGVLGLGLGAGLLTALRSIGLEQLPRAAEIQMDGGVMLAAMGVAAAVGLLIGCASLTQSFGNLGQELRGGGRGGTTGRGANRLRQSLVAAQIGFAFVLLLGAGLLSTSVRKLLDVDPGFRTEGVLTFATRASESAYPEDQDLRELMRRSLETIRALPGVEAAGVTTSIPFGSNRSDSVIFAEGYQMKPGESVISPRQLRVSTGYFETMEIELLKGRYFDERDDENAPPAVIVDERLANRFWPDSDPIGRRMWQPTSAATLLETDENTRWLTVVGVVGNVRLNDLAGSGAPVGAYYFPFAQSPESFATFAVRVAGERTDPIISAARAAMAQVDPELPLFDVHTLADRADQTVSSKRTAMTLAIGFGAVALFLSAVGIYGLLAYHVTQRRREIGIRMALGSTATGAVRLVLREGLLLSAVGLVIGAIGAVAFREVLANEVYGVSALDPWVISAVAALMTAVVAAASALPARRAGKIAPARVISQE